MNNRFSFHELLIKANSDWPNEVMLDLHVEEKHPNYRYSINKVSDLADDIAERYNNDELEVLMKNIHHAIFVVMHRLAPYIRIIRVDALRPDHIREIFESNLIFIRDSNESLWYDQDKNLIQLYFNY